jgi:hypothetical protein
VDAFFSQPPASHTWPHAQAFAREGLRSLLFSRSYIPGRQTPAGAEVVQAVDEVFDRFCPAGGSSVLVGYETILLLDQIR